MSAVALLISGVASIAVTPEQILGWVASIAGAVFLLFVKTWIESEKEKARKIMDTLRAQNEKQADLERVLYHFIGQVQARLGLHSIDSDPEIRIAHRSPEPHAPRPTNGPTE